jgi:PAS domain S-box-containing protein
MKDEYLDPLFRFIFDHQSIGSTIIDSNKKFIKVNEKFCEMTGFTESELIGKSPIDITLPEDKELTATFQNKLNFPNTDNTYEKRYLRKNGSIIWVKVITKTIHHPSLPSQNISIALIEDITFHKALEAQAHFNQMQLTAILETAVLGVWCVDPDWKITYSNRALQNMLGYSEKQLATLNLRELTHPEDLKETNNRFDQTIPGQTYQAFRRYLKNDGNYLWVRISVSKFSENNKNKKFYGISIVEDVSAQKEAEILIKNQQIKLIASAKMAALGEMAGGMAHEINNPLTIISGKLYQLTKILNEPKLDIPKIKNEIETIEKNSIRISNIIKSLLSFSRNADSDPWAPAFVNDIIENVESLCKERFKAHGVQLKMNLMADKSQSEILCKQIQIVQIILNIVSNAFDAVENLPMKWIQIDVSSNNEMVQIKITDSGTGIPENIAEKIMLPFFTTKIVGKGTGLGLSAAIGIIEDHKGTLKYDKKSKNTCFILEIPKKELNI